MSNDWWKITTVPLFFLNYPTLTLQQSVWLQNNFHGLSTMLSFRNYINVWPIASAVMSITVCKEPMHMFDSQTNSAQTDFD